MRDEAKLLCRLKHENVVMFHGVCLEAPNFALVMEYAAPSLYLLLADEERNASLMVINGSLVCKLLVV